MAYRSRNWFDPFEELGRLQDEINSLFNLSPTTRQTGLFDRSISPPVDIIEQEDGYTILVDLPGITKDDIDLTIANDVLTIKGDKKQAREEDSSKVYKKETWTGNFQRTVSLPDSVDPNKVEANLKNGVLNIALVKKEESKPKQISVNVK